MLLLTNSSGFAIIIIMFISIHFAHRASSERGMINNETYEEMKQKEGLYRRDLYMGWTDVTSTVLNAEVAYKRGVAGPENGTEVNSTCG